MFVLADVDDPAVVESDGVARQARPVGQADALGKLGLLVGQEQDVVVLDAVGLAPRTHHPRVIVPHHRCSRWPSVPIQMEAGGCEGDDRPTTSTPLDLKSLRCAMYPGRWRSEQVGVNAPVLHSELPSARNTTARRKREGEADGEGHTGNSKKNHLLVDPLLGCIESDGLATRLDVVAGIRNVADVSSARGGQSLHRSGGNVREGDTSGESIACLERGRHFHYIWGLLIDLERIDGVELRTVGGAE